MKIKDVILEKAVSKQQQKFMGMVYAAKKGAKPASAEVAKVAKGMSKADAKDFAKTKHKGLPDKVKTEATGDKMGQVTSVTPAGDVTIKTPTGTEIKTKKDALLPGAQPGTVQMKPDATDDALKPGTQVVSTETMSDDSEIDRIKELAGSEQQDDGINLSMDYMRKEIQNSQDLSPEEKAELEKHVVVKPNGQVDVMATFSKMRGTILYSMDEVLELFIGMGKEIQQAMADPNFKNLASPEEQKGAAEFVAMIPQLQKQRQELTTSAAKDDTELNKLAAQKGDYGSMEEQQSDNVTSPISGEQDHDEISKLLVHRLRKLAGL